MIDLTLYRIRIGSFNGTVSKRQSIYSLDKVRYFKTRTYSLSCVMTLSLFICLIGFNTLASEELLCTVVAKSKVVGQQTFQRDVVDPILPSSFVGNFYSRYIHGNIINSRKGLTVYHINIRSLQNKVCELKKIISEKKPHVLGCSECELRNSFQDSQLANLKIPGYTLLLPKA